MTALIGYFSNQFSSNTTFFSQIVFPQHSFLRRSGRKNLAFSKLDSLQFGVNFSCRFYFCFGKFHSFSQRQATQHKGQPTVFSMRVM